MATEQLPQNSRPTTRHDGAASPRDRLTIAGGWSVIAICALHTLVFAAQPWWGVWLAGPFRTEEPPIEAVAQFWALPGSFVVVGVLFGISLVSTGRRGETAPVYVPAALAAWGAFCFWIVGPSGFVTLVVPVTLLTLAIVRARRAARRDALGADHP